MSVMGGHGASSHKCMQKFIILILAAALAESAAGEGGDFVPNPQRGYELLLTKAYVPAAFDDESFAEVWKSWEEPLRSWAAKASAGERRRMAFRRYGLDERPGDDRGRPLQYVVDDAGRWTINCLACHQGSVAGKISPGAGNTRYAMETLAEDIRKTKLRLGKPFAELDLAALAMPMGTTIGTTNAVMFGMAVMNLRDADMNLRPSVGQPTMMHHDHDAPAWWNTSRKQRLYCDDFAPRGHRALMQFAASTENPGEKFREWEDDFRHIEAYIDSLEPPKYPFAINRELAEAGRDAFNRTCAECHGEYGAEAEADIVAYPERIVPIEEVGTDPVRLEGLTVAAREHYGRNWINEYGRKGAVIADPGGYVAPPLDGVWASAPYFHNGSAPTLWHVLHPKSRPVVWARVDDQNDPRGLGQSEAERVAADYDSDRVGIAVEQFEKVPANMSSAAQGRRFFDTRSHGKSAAGHEFPNALSDEERRAVLEYLKTL
jgi:hypothetical protein